MKTLISITIQKPDEEDIKHAMVAIPNMYQIHSQLKGKIASNLIVLLANLQEYPDDIDLPVLDILEIKIL
jgi:hypothetical protein